MSDSTIKISAGFAEVNPIFHLKRINQEEENQFWVNIGAVESTQDQAQKREHDYQCCVSALKEWSSTGLTKAIGNGDEPFYEEGSPADQIDRYFEEAKERGEDVTRTAQSVVNKYLAKLQPTVVFW